jgi:hypothetical protein
VPALSLGVERDQQNADIGFASDPAPGNMK